MAWNLFFVRDDKKIVGKVLKGLELTAQKDNKLTLAKLKFSMNSYENLVENETKKLLETETLLKTLQTFWTCGCLKIPYKNQQPWPVGLSNCIFMKTFLFPMKTANYTVTKN